MKSIYKTEIDLQVIKGWCLLKTYSLSTTKTDKNVLFKDENLDPPRCQISLFVVAVQLLSHIQLFVTPWTAASQASLSFTVFWSLLKLMSIELVMLSNHLILCCPLLLLPSIFPSIRIFSSESGLCIRWSKYWSFSFSPFNEYSGLISFRIRIGLKYYRGKHLSICPDPLMLTSEPGCLAVLTQVCPLKGTSPWHQKCQCLNVVWFHNQSWLLSRPWFWICRLIHTDDILCW